MKPNIIFIMSDQMLTDGRFKYIYTVYGGVEELYDLEIDPHEMHNLAMEWGSRAAEYRKLLWQWCTDNGAIWTWWTASN